MGVTDSMLECYDNEDKIFDDCMTYLIGGSHTTTFCKLSICFGLRKLLLLPTILDVQTLLCQLEQRYLWLKAKPKRFMVLK